MTNARPAPPQPSDPILARLSRLHPKSIDLSLGRIEALLEALGSPHLALPPTFHVAGTNGKGSTVAYLRAILEASGKSVHVYTSPHLVRFNERIVVAGAPIADERLLRILETCEAVNAGAPITFFEITTAAAFVAFAEEPADAVVLEVGLGGRLDATNVIARPLASIIAPVGIDHTEYLGPDLASIAGEKAGILKAGVPGIVARQAGAAEAVIRAAGARVRAPLLFAGSDFDAHEEHGRMVFQDDAGLLDLPRPRLLGAHQIDNAALAVAALRTASPFTHKDADFARGLSEVQWPARLQRLSHGPLIAAAPAGSDLWLDGAHNAMGAEALAAAITAFEERNPRPLVLIVGILKTKDAAAILGAFRGIASKVFAVPVKASDAGLSPGSLYDIASALGFESLPAQSPLAAMRLIAADHAGAGEGALPPRILILGSLYLAGDVLAENN